MSLYEEQIKPHFKRIEEWVKDGAAETQIAEALGVSYSSWKSYKRNIPEFKAFLESIDRTNLVLELRSLLLQKARGHTKKVKKAMKCKNILYNDDGKRISEEERVEYYDEEIYFPPDNTAIFGCLNIFDKTYVRDRAAHELRLKEIEIKEKESF